MKKGEELTFDYGTEFWDGRVTLPTRHGRPSLCFTHVLRAWTSPLSSAAPCAGPSRAEKVAALRRALDYFGVSGEIEVPPSSMVSMARGEAVAVGVAAPILVGRCGCVY